MSDYWLNEAARLQAEVDRLKTELQSRDAELAVLKSRQYDIETIVRECADIAKTAAPYSSDDLILKRFGFDQ
jgi:hypothetical protein